MTPADLLALDREPSPRCSGCGDVFRRTFDDGRDEHRCAKCGEWHCWMCSDYHSGAEPECGEAMAKEAEKGEAA